LDETDKKEVLKSIIRRLHEGADPEEVKEEFKDVLKGTESFDIAQIEQQLIEEGMPIEEIRRLCDVHLALFRESLEEEKVEVPEGHPIHILMEEHRIILGFYQTHFLHCYHLSSIQRGFERISESVEAGWETLCGG